MSDEKLMDNLKQVFTEVREGNWITKLEIFMLVASAFIATVLTLSACTDWVLSHYTDTNQSNLLETDLLQDMLEALGISIEG